MKRCCVMARTAGRTTARPVRANRMQDQGSTVTLMASPRATMSNASRASANGMWRVIRSFTGIAPVEMYSKAALWWAGADPLAPWMCNWR